LIKTKVTSSFRVKQTFSFFEHRLRTLRVRCWRCSKKHRAYVSFSAWSFQSQIEETKSKRSNANKMIMSLVTSTNVRQTANYSPIAS